MNTDFRGFVVKILLERFESAVISVVQHPRESAAKKRNTCMNETCPIQQKEAVPVFRDSLGQQQLCAGAIFLRFLFRLL